MHLIHNSLFREKYNIWLQNYHINSCKNGRDGESLERLGVSLEIAFSACNI